MLSIDSRTKRHDPVAIDQLNVALAFALPGTSPSLVVDYQPLNDTGSRWLVLHAWRGQYVVHELTHDPSIPQRFRAAGGSYNATYSDAWANLQKRSTGYRASA